MAARRIFENNDEDDDVLAYLKSCEVALAEPYAAWHVLARHWLNCTR